MDEPRAEAQFLRDRAAEHRQAGRSQEADDLEAAAAKLWTEPEPHPGASGEEPEQVHLAAYHERMKAELEAMQPVDTDEEPDN